ncbi:hypothetical protein RJT34_32741 [Clitoria ternatea]|uniref:Uncharacterized protein n=1 Tax=Clitoria ternatea TaxID=43366 RepID=A0AAN9F0V1_CLITE
MLLYKFLIWMEIYYLDRSSILCGNPNVQGLCHFLLSRGEDIPAVPFTALVPILFNLALSHVVPSYCPKLTLFFFASTVHEFLQVMDEFGLQIIFTFAFFLDPVTVAVPWQMAVIPFGHEMPPMRL